MRGKPKKAALELADLIATNDRDVFILREGDGVKTVSGFDPGEDKVLFDFNSYSDVLGFGQLSDGQIVTDFTGQTSILVQAVDANNDGLIDTSLSVENDSITLLGVAPHDLYSGNLMGG